MLQHNQQQFSINDLWDSELINNWILKGQINKIIKRVLTKDKSIKLIEISGDLNDKQLFNLLINHRLTITKPDINGHKNLIIWE